MEMSVSGCRLPNVSRAISSDSRNSGSASSCLPWACSSCASLSKPRAQQLDAQRVAVLVLALAAAVGCVLLRTSAPPMLEAVAVGPHGGAAAGARLHERAVAFALQAQPAPPLVLLLAGALALGARARRHSWCQHGACYFYITNAHVHAHVHAHADSTSVVVRRMPPQTLTSPTHSQPTQHSRALHALRPEGGAPRRAQGARPGAAQPRARLLHDPVHHDGRPLIDHDVPLVRRPDQDQDPRADARGLLLAGGDLLRLHQPLHGPLPLQPRAHLLLDGARPGTPRPAARPRLSSAPGLEPRRRLRRLRRKHQALRTRRTAPSHRPPHAGRVPGAQAQPPPTPALLRVHGRRALAESPSSPGRVQCTHSLPSVSSCAGPGAARPARLTRQGGGDLPGAVAHRARGARRPPNPDTLTP
eukprot:scaffold83733_cov59-Phaeocystis_antarctica.AAC.2